MREVWAYRELLYFFVWRDLKVRYKQTVVGVAWVIIQPLLSMGVFTLFFGRLAKLPSDGLPYPVFYFAALAPWTYFSTALTTATNVVVENQRVITKVYFPRLILPLSSVMSGLVDFGIAFVVLLAMVLGYGLRPGLQAIWLPFLVVTGAGDGTGRGVVAFRAECAVPRREICDALSGPVLDAGVAGGISEQLGASEMAMVVRAEPDGWCD